MQKSSLLNANLTSESTSHSLALRIPFWS